MTDLDYTAVIVAQLISPINCCNYRLDGLAVLLVGLENGNLTLGLLQIVGKSGCVTWEANIVGDAIDDKYRNARPDLALCAGKLCDPASLRFQNRP